MDSKKQAQGIAALGRYGDTTLMHMRPDEVEQLTAISRANGGDITINPDTGMPEAFLGDFFSALAPTAAGLAAGAIFPGAPFLAPALAGGTTAFLQGKRDPLSIGMGALSGYGGGQLGSSLRGFGASQGATAGSAEVAGGAGGTPVADVATTGSTIGASGGTTAGANAFGQQQFISPFTPTGVTGSQMANPALTSGTMTTAQVNQLQNLQGIPGGTYTGPQGMAQTIANQPGGYQPPTGPLTQGGGFESQAQYNQRLADYTGDTSMMQSKRLGSFEEGIDLGRGLAKTGKGFEAAMQDPMGYLKYAGDGSALMGGVKTALPFAGAGLEAYQKGIYEDLPTYEASTAGRYDPTRTLNLGMDTGLRLLAQGGEVKKYAEGDKVVRDQSYYGINPQYQTSTSYSGPYGVMGGTTQSQTRVPVMGYVDVGGKFVADPKGTMSDIDYENRFKYVTEGVAKPGDESGGDFEARAGLQGAAGGINPAVALQAAQGYADSQQSDLNQQGLGTLKTGGSVRRFQMGGTTAEENKQNIQSMYGEPGKTTAEQNLSRDAIQEAGTVVTQQMGNDLTKKAGETFSKLPVVPGDANNNMAKILGVAMQSNPQAFTVVPNTSTTPQGLTALNLNTGRQEPTMGMAAGGITGLTPDDGKMLNGNGDGVSDEIPAMIEGEQEAALSDGEFIVPARIVSELGNGSSDAGAQKLYAMIDRIQAARSKTMGDNKEYAKDTNAERYLPA
jgi:hypothetical protein